MNTNPPEFDRLNSATDALRATPIPPGPAEDLIAATVATLGSRRELATPNELERKLQRRKRLMRILQYGGLSMGTTIAAVMVVLAYGSHSPAEDLKKAIRKAEQAKTARFVVELDTGDPASKMISKSYITEGKMRTEVEPVGLVLVLDSKTDNKGVMLLTKMKMYRLLDPDKDELVKSVTKNVKSAMEQFKIPSDDKVKGLADEYLDGRRTKVYEMKGVEVPELKGTATLKMWIDPKTDLPIRSQVVTRAGDKTYTATATYLGFDEDLDPKLFESKIPDDFKLMPEMKK